jgi:TatD DNase family protein
MKDDSKYYPQTVDSHCHLDALRAAGFEVPELLSEAARMGVIGILDVGTLPGDLERRRVCFGNVPFVRFASGLHPGNVGDADMVGELRTLRKQARAGAITAVGEIGLDYYRGVENKADQLHALVAQVEIAREFDLPVVIHNRDADTDVVTVLGEYRPSGVMHCFGQSVEFCRSCLDLGMYISFAGNVTFRNATDLQEVARFVPGDRLLVETDAPVLSPVPVRGRPNHIGHLGFTIEFVAQLRGGGPEELAALTAANASALFGVNSWTAGQS